MTEISIYPMIPATGKSLWLFVPLLLMLAAVAGLLIFLMFSSQKTRFEISAEGLRIRGDIYGRVIPRDHLLPEEAVALDLAKDGEWQPKWRTNGAALPGYQSGWFRLRNKAKALLFVTDQHRVVKLPTRDGYTILMSVTDPGRFIADAKKLWASKAVK